MNITERYKRLSISRRCHSAGAAMMFMFVMLVCSGILLPSCAYTSSRQPPEARKGRLDLSAWNFEKDGVVKLDGEWEFYWKQLLKPDDFTGTGPLPRSSYIMTPGTWDSHREGVEPIANTGFATYRLVVRAQSDSSLALHLPVIYSSSRVWIDGRLLASTGRVGESRNDSAPSWRSLVVPIDRSRGETEIIIQASNFFFRRGGIRGEVMLGTNAEISGRKYFNIAFIAFVFGSLVIIGIYHLSLHAFRKKDRASLYFGVFCLLVAAYSITGPDEHLIADALPDMNGAFVYRFMLLVYIASMPAFVLFQRALYPDDVAKKVGTASVILAAGYLSMILIESNDRLSSIDPLYHPVTIGTSLYLVFTLVRSVARKREGARLALGGALVLLVGVIIDILYDFGVGQINFAVPIGVLAFILSYSFILSKRFSRAFSVIEQQEAALQQANIGLEAKVRERTTSLERSVQEKEVLLREVHHRVKNNLQVIVSLLNLQSDDVADGPALRALMESKGRIRSMMHIHEKLYNSRNLAELDLNDYIGNIVSDIFSTYGADRKRIDYTVQAPVRKLDLDAAVPCGLIINELVTNSLKHAFPGDRTAGSIAVRLADGDGGGYELSVSDNGIGLPRTIDMSAASTLGLRLVYGLATRQLKGDIAVSREQGTGVSIRFGQDKAH